MQKTASRDHIIDLEKELQALKSHNIYLKLVEKEADFK
jgi:hypothetical protein